MWDSTISSKSSTRRWVRLPWPRGAFLGTCAGIGLALGQGSAAAAGQVRCSELSGQPGAPAAAVDESTSGVAGPEADPVSGASQRVFIDPQTGELLDRPPPDHIPEPPAEAPATLPDIAVEKRPDGTVVADVSSRFMTELRVEIIDGRAVTCHRAAGEGVVPESDHSAPQLSGERGDGR